jgi:hypothetical protein
MSGFKIYNCEKCGEKVTLAEGEEDSPECCSQTMSPLELPPCESSSTAEHSRMNASDEPCDDGRAGGK